MQKIEISKLGMTEKEILESCSDKNNYPLFRGAPYWTAEIYSFGKYIRQYGFYPKFLPLAIYTDHGPGRITDEPFKHELDSDTPTMFYHSLESVTIWKKFSTTPCYVLYSPFVFYRRKEKIIQNLNARGTLAFPTHSTKDIRDLTNIEEYIRQLKKLPEKFQPVSICLHISDVKEERYKIFMANGFPVYTIGGNNEEFAIRFYDVLKNFSYATSNLIGSSLYYAVEMGIPFFLYGDRPLFYNSGDTNMPDGLYDFYKKDSYYHSLHQLFTGLDCEITNEKKKIIETDLGIYDGIGRSKMAVILYWSFLKWFFSPRFWKWLYQMLLKIKKVIK